MPFVICTKLMSSSSSSVSSSSPFYYASAKEICTRVLQLDSSIRFAGIANNMGTLIAYEWQKDVEPLLNEEELRDNIMKSVLRMKTREDYESRLGEVIYTFALYKKVKRATIPLPNHHPYLAVLAVSFEVDADHENIILDKILPMIRREKSQA